MKSLKLISLLAFLMLAFAISAAAQVNVNPGAGSYTTLKGAFDAINAGTHTGAVTVDIVGDTTETASAVLNASGAGAASYTSIIISPSGGAARTISGAVVGHLVDLNGADNVTINGLNAGGNALTISNTAAGASSTIRFTNDATLNVVQNSTLLGSTTSFGVVYFATGTTTGVVYFATTTIILITIISARQARIFRSTEYIRSAQVQRLTTTRTPSTPIIFPIISARVRQPTVYN